MSIEIELVGKYGKGKLLIVDDDDYEKVSKRTWYVTPNGYVVAADSTQGEKLHRIIMGCKSGDGVMIDHINHDKLDNRKANLRICTNSQNQANALPRKGLSTKGVYLTSKGWMARICKDGRRIYLGHFKKKEDAQKAYDIAGKELFGSFMQTNENT